MMLSDLEDRFLALCEGDHISIKLAQRILSSWYVRNFSASEIIQIANKLAKLNLLQWKYSVKSKHYISKQFPTGIVKISALRFKASNVGEQYLAEPRRVT